MSCAALVLSVCSFDTLIYNIYIYYDNSLPSIDKLTSTSTRSKPDLSLGLKLRKYVKRKTNKLTDRDTRVVIVIVSCKF